MPDSELPVKETEEEFNPIIGVKQPPPLVIKKQPVSIGYNYLAQSFEDGVFEETSQHKSEEAVVAH